MLGNKKGGQRRCFSRARRGSGEGNGGAEVRTTSMMDSASGPFHVQAQQEEELVVLAVREGVLMNPLPIFLSKLPQLLIIITSDFYMKILNFQNLVTPSWTLKGRSRER